MAKTRKRPRTKSLAPVALGGEVREEDLRYPFVYYPHLYGTFLAFSSDESSTPLLCACSKGALRNYTLLCHPNLWTSGEEDSPSMVSLRALPPILAELSIRKRRPPVDCIEFAPRLCHRCNGAAPSMRYCHEMYGGIFQQTYGWYTNLAAYRMGVDPKSLFCLEDACPQEIVEEIAEWKAAAERAQAERERLESLMHEPRRPEIDESVITYWHNATIQEGKAYRSLERKASQAHRRITKRFENIAREEFGFSAVGESWVSESLLGKILGRLLPESKIIRHDRPEWLDGLELDFYCPALRLALEYQGQQHFRPVEAWGGKAALAGLQRRDVRKAALCEERGVELVLIDYTEPLTEEHVRARLNEHAIKSEGF